MSDECRVIQVTNVAPTATKDQMKTLFSYIGKIDDIVLYPTTETANCSRVCFVKFADPENVGVSLHLSNTVFIDRALIVMPVPDSKIPDEKSALGAQSASTGLYAGLGNYPSLPESTELSKVDEIRRTVYVSNIDQTITAEMLLQLFAQAGEVKYVRMAGDDTFSIRGAFIEFSEQISVMRALALTGQTVGDRPIRVAPANTAITKPTPAVLMGATSKEIDDAMRKVNEAQPLISAVLDSDSKRHRSRSKSHSHRSRSHRSHSRRRSRSRSRSHRSRSHRSRSRRRSRSRSSRRSRSPKRRRSRSPRRHRSRSRSHHRRRRSRSPISSRSRRSRSREKSRKSRSKSRGTTPDKDKRRSNRDVDRVKKGSSSGSPRHRSSSSPHKSTKKRSRSRSTSESRASKRERGRDRKRDDSGERERNSRKSKRCKEDGDGLSSDRDDDVLRANLRNSDDDHEPVSMSMSDGNESD